MSQAAHSHHGHILYLTKKKLQKARLGPAINHSCKEIRTFFSHIPIAPSHKHTLRLPLFPRCTIPQSVCAIRTHIRPPCRAPSPQAPFRFLLPTLLYRDTRPVPLRVLHVHSRAPLCSALLPAYSAEFTGPRPRCCVRAH